MIAPTHILNGKHYPPEATVWRALCGASCFALDDEHGELDPPNFDFYLLGFGHEKASCIACKNALPRVNKKRIAVLV